MRTWKVGWPRHFRPAIAAGSGILIFAYCSFIAWGAEPVDPYKGLRETTKQYIALGTPDDLLRLQDALQKTEQEIARLKLGALHPEKQPQLNAMRDRLAESEALLRLLDSSAKEIPNRELDHVSAKDRASLHTNLLGRIEAARESVGVLEKEIGFVQAENLRSLEDERKALARHIAVRREQLLEEYTRLPECSTADRPCLARRLKTLCKLTPLFSDAERIPILNLIQEVDRQLNISSRPTSATCEYFKHDFGL